MRADASSCGTGSWGLVATVGRWGFRAGSGFCRSLASQCRHFFPIACHIALVLSKGFSEDGTCVIINYKVEFGALGRVERGAQRDLTGTGNGSGRQTGVPISVEWRVEVQITRGDAA